jgi:hypothetical protein
MLHRTSRVAGGLLLALAAAACGGGGKDPLDHALDFALEGTFADIDGLAAEFDGESDVVAVDFGGSVMGTNPSVFARGDALVSDVACDEDSCTGQVVVPHVDAQGRLTSVTRETGTFRRDGNDVVVESPSHGRLRFAPWTAPAPGGDGDGDGDGVLQADASCPEWWAAMKAKGTWTVSYYRNLFMEEPTGGTVTFTFSGDNQFQVSGDIEDIGWGGFTQGTFVFDENFLGAGMCRVYPQSSDGHSLPPWFAYSLSNGKLVFKLSTTIHADGLDELHLE